ncbi:glycosyltransferase family 1 protein [Candidatus Pacearchaeota archaeon]|nr:glycosyltransferase family 1 protein [Candidatus Pacearchaeota archaeon]
MNINFYSFNSNRCDYLTDGLLYGLKKLYNVVDFPKRVVLYEDSYKNNFYTNRNLWHFGNLVDNINREGTIKPDLLVCDSVVLYKKYSIPSVYLLTNDPFEQKYHVYPNIRINTPMAIREKCMHTNEINKKDIKDFPLYFTTFKEDCKYMDSSLRKGIWVSFLYPTKEREEIIKEFGNTKYNTKEDYYNSLRKAKYGIGVYGLGFLCQRDIEIAGNCLLCRKRHKKWEYTDLDYKDGETCIEFSTIKELKEKMKYYDEHPKEYKKLLKNCYNHTIKYFIHEAQAKRLVDWRMKNGY